MSNIAVNIVPADGLAASGARASAGTVMTKIMPLSYSGSSLKGREN